MSCTHASIIIDDEVGYGQELFEFQGGRIITCKTIYAMDDRVSDGTQISRLIIDAQQGTTVPIVILPQSIPITIIDNDGEYIQMLSACKLKQHLQTKIR